MRAVLCKQYGPASELVVDEIEAPSPGAGEVLVDVHAAGVNFPDTLIIEGRYQFKPEPPFSPGSEVAGIVRAVGEGVTAFEPGDRVVASMMWGGFAESVATDASRVIGIPDGVSFETAAAFVQAYGTSYYALKTRAVLEEGEALVVLGAAGGVGLAAVELGKVMGAKVIAAASTDEKLELCRARGADEVINYSTEDLKSRIKALTGGRGADVVYDPVGGSYSEAALRATAWGGRFLVIGFAAGDIPAIPLNLVLLKSCQVVGVFWGAFTVREPKQHEAQVKQLTEWLADGTLKPHVHEAYPLEDAARALDDMSNRRVRGKAVIKVR